MKIKIELKNNPYFVNINENFDDFDFNKFSKIFVLFNETLFNLHEKKLKSLIKSSFVPIIIKDGEEYKNLATIEFILNELFRHKADRKALLIAFGGGVITDIGGFVASIYQRGIKSLYIPTTLLSCVDAAVGGKTGINSSFGKNLIGSFYQPSGVYIFTDFFTTLDIRQIKAAMSEVIKIAATFDANFFEYLQKIDKNDFFALKDEIILKILQKSIELKAKVVIKDEKENNLRKALNYGHTFAHAIEKMSNYKEFLHGEAVSIGICMVNDLACNLGILEKKLAQQIKTLLEDFGLPTSVKIKNKNEFYEDLFLDKKSEFNKICFVLLKNLGNFEFFYDIKKEDILNIIKG